MALGVAVKTSETPLQSGVPTDTSVAFVIGEADTGPTNQAVELHDMADVAAAIGPRSTTNSEIYDSLDAFFNIGGATAYFGRVVGPNAVNAHLTLNDQSGHPTLVATADYPGVDGNELQIAVLVSGGSYQITIEDLAGNTLAQSPSLATQAAGIAWSQSAPFLTLTASTATGATTANPAALAATPLAGGTDDWGEVTLTQWENALALFPARLGPGQVLAPGATDTSVPGIWDALLFHAYQNNRFALLDLDLTTPAALIAATARVRGEYYASYGEFHAPRATIPGVTPGTLRTVPASAVMAGLCAVVDKDGNPNRMVAGDDYPIPYIVGLVYPTGVPYLDSDVLLMNENGINSFSNQFGTLESYGFSSLVGSDEIDEIYWQAEHSRLRMALVAEGLRVGHPFVFRQIDGKGIELAAFGTAVSSMLSDYQKKGALWGFTVDVGPTVNPPAQLQAGNVKARCAVQMSPGAQYVEIDLAAAPITQTL